MFRDVNWNELRSKSVEIWQGFMDAYNCITQVCIPLRATTSLEVKRQIKMDGAESDEQNKTETAWMNYRHRTRPRYRAYCKVRNESTRAMRAVYQFEKSLAQEVKEKTTGFLCL